MECEIFSNTGNSICVLDIVSTGRQSKTDIRVEVVNPDGMHYYIHLPDNCYIIPVEYMIR